MKRVWRLELENGNGPYFPFADEVMDLHTFIGLPLIPDRHPEPSDEFPGPERVPSSFEYFRLIAKVDGAQRDARFGFASLEQYRQWFFTASSRRRLAQMGAQLVCYSVDNSDILAGRKQLVFDRNRAKKIEYRSPSQFHRFIGRQLELL